MKPFKGIVGVMGSGENATQKDIKTAEFIGNALAGENYIVLCGGRNEGVMKAVASGVKDSNGLSIGILPGSSTQDASPDLTIPIITGIGSARNNINILTSEIIIAIGHTPGTLSEIALALKYNKMIILLNQSKESKLFFNALNYRGMKIFEEKEKVPSSN